MTKSIHTLKQDIEHVIKTGEGWTKEISEWIGQEVSELYSGRMSSIGGERKRNLRMSNLGTPCARKLWYHINSTSQSEPLPASTLNKFLFGDLTELHLLGLCKAAGHEVTGLQDQMDIRGIKGHRDCVIDGMLFDIKSASSFAFRKFSEHRLRQDDPFGYISQLSSYLYASRNDPLVRDKTRAGFLVQDKQLGHICVDIYDLSEEINKKEEEVEKLQEMVSLESPPDRTFEPVPYGKSGNMCLPTNCSYCEWKYNCWDNLRTFVYSNGPVYMTKVDREPSSKVMEITNEKHLNP